ncbi:MAG: hypothetical protein JHC33_11775 [Ignisphaera sp.]|nr:hypothetical protein [Ignisphaera sp.]
MFDQAFVSAIVSQFSSRLDPSKHSRSQAFGVVANLVGKQSGLKLIDLPDGPNIVSEVLNELGFNNNNTSSLF